jgi:hypothetical protein
LKFFVKKVKFYLTKIKFSDNLIIEPVNSSFNWKLKLWRILYGGSEKEEK